MEFKTPSAVFIVAMACTGLAFILQIVGLATPGWLVSDVVGTGLWKVCREGVCVDIGTILPIIPDWFIAVRALGIVSVCCLAGCLLVSVASCVFEHSYFPLICAGLAVAGGLCSLAEFATFAAKYADVVKGKGGPDFGYSFALTIVAWLLAMMACPVFIFAKLRKQSAN
ncbi:epithelial membrane protein 3-like [Littorina saxatilis]|uniref:Uncharacterized protein n=1 Tax=Littorina saxatilis TaxID=31220 RepID=A0AAN9ARA4_9CAEN